MTEFDEERKAQRDVKFISFLEIIIPLRPQRLPSFVNLLKDAIMSIFANSSIKHLKSLTKAKDVWSSSFVGQGSSLGGLRPSYSLRHASAEAVAVHKHWKEIPTLKSYPIVGANLSLFLRKDFNTAKMHLTMENIFKELGPIFRLKPIGLPPMVCLSEPDDFEVLFRATMNNPIRIAFLSLKEVRTRDPFFENKAGLLAENYEEWKRVRSRVSTPMLRPKNITKYLPNMDSVAMQFVERIEELAQKNDKQEMPQNFINEIYRWALESVGTVALNRRLGCLEPNLAPDSPQETIINEVNEIFHVMSELEMNLPFWRLFDTPKLKKFIKGHKLFTKIAEEAILETEKQLHMKTAKPETSELTLMETLLNTKGLTRSDVITMILDMFLAGIDTTSHSLAYTLYLLARNPKAQQKLFDEVDSVVGSSVAPISERQLAKLAYLKSCVRESLRLFPVVLGANRLTEEDSVLGGYLIPKGWLCACFTYNTSRSEKNFKRAAEFLPERWGRDKPLGPIHPFASIPFSHGPRMCIGRRIAEQEIYVALIRIIQRFVIDYKHADMSFYTTMVSVPAEPLKFEFIERSKM